ncbi:uncharacterized protein [Coffea arabica]|uniref:G-patch domain-containing protein n=1 Tax=Coffea arabica TaxID=13443 RepID=A0ABM4W2Y2_COFAR
MPLDPQAFYQTTAEPVVPEHIVQTKPEVGESSAPMDMKLLKRLDRFDEFIKKSQGLSKQGVLDYDDLCLFPNVQLPVGFKTPKFNKYDGTGNPKTHLRLFANKLGRPVDDENLPLRLFLESLEGDALDWYSNLKPEEVKNWFDLSNAFIRQYEYNCGLAPTRTTLEDAKRRPSEDHKTYAKRWRKIAAKVEPPMTEDEIIRTFIKAHDPPHFEEIFRMTGCSFAAIVNKLEKYDDFVRIGKIVNVSALKSQVEALQGQGSRAPGHSTLDCKALKHKVQDMIEAGEIVIRKREAQGPNINRNPLPEHANTIGVILDDAEYDELAQKLAREAEVFGVTDQPFIIEAPVLSLQRVPWNYNESVIQIGGKPVAKEEVSVVTRSGRIASPFGATVPIQTNSPELPAKPAITEKEALDFLKRLQRSEYNVVEKLSKSPAQISMLDLFFSSDMHRDALLEVLTKAQIPKDISVANFSYIVGNVLSTKQITFSDDELPAEGIGHNKALYIAMRCNGKMLPKALIDNGSALNICPWSTLEKLGLQDIKLRSSGTIVRGFDGAQREPIGEVDLLITIFAEEDCFVIADSGSEEDGSRNATVTPHNTADIVSVSWITKEERALSKASVMMAKEMIRGGYEFDKGLGRDLQGILKPVEIVEKKDSFGLGFRPTAKDIKEMKKRKRAEKEGRQKAFDIPPLHYTFPRPTEVITSEINPVDEIETSLAQLFVGATFEDSLPDEAENGAFTNETTTLLFTPKSTPEKLPSKQKRSGDVIGKA